MYSNYMKNVQTHKPQLVKMIVLNNIPPVKMLRLFHVFGTEDFSFFLLY